MDKDVLLSPEYEARRTTREEHAAQAASTDLVPIRLIPVEQWGAEECDRCGNALSYGLCDSADPWLDCNSAHNHLFRPEGDQEKDWQRPTGDVVLVWVDRRELEKFRQILGEPRWPTPEPHMATYEVEGTGVTWHMLVTATAPQRQYSAAKPYQVSIPNDDPKCRCSLVQEGGAFTGVKIDPDCVWHVGEDSDG